MRKLNWSANCCTELRTASCSVDIEPERSMANMMSRGLSSFTPRKALMGRATDPS